MSNSSSLEPDCKGGLGRLVFSWEFPVWTRFQLIIAIALGSLYG